MTDKQVRQSLFVNKVAGLTPGILLKNKLQHRCFLLSFEKVLRTCFFKEHVLWLLPMKGLEEVLNNKNC